MTISFSCTGCEHILKVSNELAGRKGKCPHCKAMLVIPDGPLSAMTAAAPARKKAVPAPPPPPEEPQEDADHAEDETTEEAAPRREKKGKKKKKAKKSLMLPLLLIGGGVLLLLCAGGGATGVWWFWPAGAADDYYFLPDNTQIVGVVHVDQLMNSAAFQQARSEIPEINQQLLQAGNQSAGIDPGNVDQLVFGGQTGTGPAAAGNMNFIMHMKQPAKPGDLEASFKKNSPDLNFTEVKLGRYTLYEGSVSKPAPFAAPPPSFLMPDDKRVVIGQSSTLRSVLQRDKKPDFSDKLQAAVKQTDFNATIAVAVNAKDALPKTLAPPRPGAPAAPNPFEKVDGLSVTAKVGADVDLNVVALCQDAQAAGEANTSIKDGVKKLKGVVALLVLTGQAPPELNDMLDIDPQVSGSNLSVAKTIKVAPLIKMLKDQQKAALPIPGKH